MRYFFIVLGFCIFAFISKTESSFAQSKNDATVVATVGKQKVTYGQLKENFNRGLDETPTLEDLENFLPVYMDYLAKIQSAEDRGYFKDPELMAEYEQYSKQAAYSYWLENKIKPTEFDKYYKKAAYEVKSEHVLIALLESAAPEDTLEAYNTLMKARDEFLAGKATMKELNEKYSSRNQGQLMGGDLPWFGVGSTVTDFEDALYGLEIGEISLPVRSQFGYHLIHLSDKRIAAPARNVSHIYVRTLPDKDKEKIEQAYNDLQKGLPWGLAVEMYSEDGPTIGREGNIGWVRYGAGYNADFVNFVMNANPDVEYNEPVKTPYGYHIFKIDSVETYANEEEKRASFLNAFIESPNYKKSNTYIVDWIKRNTDFQLNDGAVEKYTQYMKASDEELITNVAPVPFGKEELTSFLGHKASVNDFDTYVKTRFGSATIKEFDKNWIWDFTDKLIDDYIIELVNREYPGFNDQLKNYKIGLAVYKINDDNVWSAATVDSTALMEIYNKEINKYHFDRRKFYYVITSGDSTLYDAVNFIREGNSPDSIRVYYPKVSVQRDSSGIRNDDYNEYLDKLDVGGFSEEFEYKRRNTFLYLQDILPARNMSFEEAFQRLLSEYQPVREEKWLNELRKKYKMKPDLKNLQKAYKNENNS